MDYSVDQRESKKVALANDPIDFSSVFLGFSTWGNNFSAQQVLFDCEFMKLISELRTM